MTTCGAPKGYREWCGQPATQLGLPARVPLCDGCALYPPATVKQVVSIDYVPEPVPGQTKRGRR